MMGTVYVVDNNALSVLGGKRVRSREFAKYCKVPQEVIHETGGRRYRTALEHVEVKVTPEILEKLIEVMTRIRPGDFGLVDLYLDKGGADPVVIATALYLQELENAKIGPDRLVIATNDARVRQLAQESGLDWVSAESLRATLDAGPVPPDRWTTTSTLTNMNSPHRSEGTIHA